LDRACQEKKPRKKAAQPKNSQQEDREQGASSGEYVKAFLVYTGETAKKKGGRKIHHTDDFRKRVLNGIGVCRGPILIKNPVERKGGEAKLHPTKQTRGKTDRKKAFMASGLMHSERRDKGVRKTKKKKKNRCGDLGSDWEENAAFGSKSARSGIPMGHDVRAHAGKKTKKKSAVRHCEEKSRFGRKGGRRHEKKPSGFPRQYKEFKCLNLHTLKVKERELSKARSELGCSVWWGWNIAKKKGGKKKKNVWRLGKAGRKGEDRPLGTSKGGPPDK